MLCDRSTILISGATRQLLTFRRADLSDDTDNVGQLAADFKEVPELTGIACDVQPIAGSRMLNTRLASLYAQMFDVFLAGVPPVKRNDRVEINGDECVVESVNPWGSHTKLQVGAIE